MFLVYLLGDWEIFKFCHFPAPGINPGGRGNGRLRGSPGGPRFDGDFLTVADGFSGGKLAIRFINIPQHLHFGIPTGISDSASVADSSPAPVSSGTPVWNAILIRFFFAAG